MKPRETAVTLCRISLASLVIVFHLAAVVGADLVATQAGSELEGEVRMDALVLRSDGSEIEIPRTAIQEIRRTEQGLEVLLTDSTLITGSPMSETLDLAIGLVTRRIPWSEVSTVTLSGASAKEILQAALVGGDFVPVDLTTPEMGTFSTDCPLQLRLDLPRTPPSSPLQTSKTRYVECDGAVSIPMVRMRVTSHKRPGAATLEVELHVLVKPPQDKLSFFRAELELDGEAVAGVGRGRVSTEEGRSTPVRLAVSIGPAAFARWTAGVESASLTLKVRSVDD